MTIAPADPENDPSHACLRHEGARERPRVRESEPSESENDLIMNERESKRERANDYYDADPIIPSSSHSAP